MKKSQTPPRICVDMDEVIADTVAEHLTRYNRDYNGNITKADLRGKWIWDVVAIDRHPRLEEYLRMARDLGAQVVTLNGRNVSDALIRFAQQESISHVVFGQSARSRWDILLRGSVLNRFLSEIRDVTVQVVPMHKPIRKA